MELNREDSSEMREVLVGGENRELPPDGQRADQEVCVGALNSSRPASVEESRGFLVIVHRELDIREGPQIFAESFILRLSRDARQELLPDGADNGGATLANQIRQLPRLGFGRSSAAAKSE
jgi:hypothetical protein